METGKKLSVIIPSYYRYEPLEKVLNLLSRQTYKPYEIIIADQTPLNERPAGFYDQFKNLPLRILDLEKPSYSNARNSGARISEGDTLLFIDDDVEFAEDYLEMHIKVMIEENVDVVVGATSETPTLPETYSRDIRHMDPISLFLKAPHCKWNGMALYMGGLNTSIKRDVFLKVGGFDENIPRMEDIELGYRLFKSGAKIYNSYKPFAYHKRFKTGGSRKSQKSVPHAKLVSKFYFYKKHFPGWGTQQFFIREILNALSFRAPISGIFSLRSLKNPVLPFIRVYRLLKAYSEAKRLIEEIKNMQIAN